MAGLAFASPWLLTGLLALPVIWWLLRTTPPSPTRVAFPPTRILEDLINREKTPARSPWWLTLIRMAAAAAIIFALAEPVLNPTQLSTANNGRLVIVVDNGWAAAARWDARQATLERVIAGAEASSQPVMVLETVKTGARNRLRFVDAGAARDVAAGVVPHPYAPDRAAALAQLDTALKSSGETATQVIWLADGYDYGGASKFADALKVLAGDDGGVTLVAPDGAAMALALRRKSGDARALQAEILSAPGPVPRTGQVSALSQKGQQIATADFTMPAGAAQADVTFRLPLEIRNQIARIEIQSEASAGAVHLLDARSRWNRVGLVAGENREKDQPLLSPLYYLVRALKPFTDVVQSSDRSTSLALDDLLKQRASTIMLANIGTLGGQSQVKLTDWVKKGGVLVRFAGPRLEQGDDELLPSPLRFGGRTLGGALSWSEPQKLAAMDENGLFSGLNVADEVAVRRQVLADPAQLGPETKVWARLADGTPLVTARALDEGWLVLFHITANSDWSNLPLSGLFVDMLRRVLTLGSGAASGNTPTSSPSNNAAADVTSSGSQAVLAPRRMLNGRGLLGPPPASAKPLALGAFETTVPSADNPPGYYGGTDATRALNAVSANSVLTPIAPIADVVQTAYQGGTATALKPWLFLAGLALLLLDGLAVLWLSGLRPGRRTAVAAGVVLAIGLAPSGLTTSVQAQDVDTTFAIEATLKTRFAYVVTGDSAIDETSRSGLSGLRRILSRRTAVEAGEPVGVDITKDELAFFPILYWPVMPDAKTLSDEMLAKVDGYMKTGGMIVFDTKDFGNGFSGGVEGLLSPGGETPLQRMLGRLDLPRLEPVPEGHVMTKSFYLLSEFPGRWSGGEMWVEAGSGAVGESGSRVAQQTDGVSSLIVTPNDLAAAWAMDENGSPSFAVVPGGQIQREMAYRTGVNIVMYALTGNYKADQVHVPDLLKRLGQ